MDSAQSVQQKLGQRQAEVKEQLDSFAKKHGQYGQIINYLRRQHHEGTKALLSSQARMKGQNEADNLVSLSQRYLISTTQVISKDMQLFGERIMKSLGAQDKALSVVSSTSTLDSSGFGRRGWSAL